MNHLRCHHCIAELVDNAVAATGVTGKFKIELGLFELTREQGESARLKFYLGDTGGGMRAEELAEVLNPGFQNGTGNGLNEHGWGLKNALCTMSRDLPWKIFSREDSGGFACVSSPWDSVKLDDDADATDVLGYFRELKKDEIRTIIECEVQLDFAQTLSDGVPGNRSENVAILLTHLSEHLGVMYRGYLSNESFYKKSNIKGEMYVGMGKLKPKAFKVLPIEPPRTRVEEMPSTLVYNGKPIDIMVRSARFNKDAREKVVASFDSLADMKIYYKGNQKSQGLDLMIGGRVLIPSIFEEIWSLERHNDYNIQTGEIILPHDLDRADFPTTRTKDGFARIGSGWKALWDEVSELQPKPLSEKGESASEAKRRDALVAYLDNVNAVSTGANIEVDKEVSIWSAGVKADVVAKQSGLTTVHELKLGPVKPIHVYQALMYWDGLVKEGHQVVKGIVHADSCSSNIKAMMTTLSGCTDANGQSYSLEFQEWVSSVYGGVK